MTSRQARLKEDTYFKLMRTLQQNPDINQRELAEKNGYQYGRIQLFLKALMKKGLVKMKKFASAKNRFCYVYMLTPNNFAEKAAITQSFLQRKLDEYDSLNAEIESLKAEANFNQMDDLRKKTQ